MSDPPNVGNPDPHTTLSPVGDLAYFLDADLAVLGKDTGLYARYAQQIRAEYNHVSDYAFREGRGKIMKSFLDNPVLYFTTPMRQAFEAQARSNITNEIRALASMPGS